jgi:hypothetical protein
MPAKRKLSTIKRNLPTAKTALSDHIAQTPERAEKI